MRKTLPPNKLRLLYLLDANVLIRAQHDYYNLERVPHFWEWLLAKGTEGRIKIPFEIYEEITAGKDQLSDWMKEKATKDALLFDESVDGHLAKRVFSQGYASDLEDWEYEEIGRDPLLVAYALKSPKDRRVVTKEARAPSKTRSNRKVPDVCDVLGVTHVSDFQIYSDLDFRTR